MLVAFVVSCSASSPLSTISAGADEEVGSDFVAPNSVSAASRADPECSGVDRHVACANGGGGVFDSNVLGRVMLPASVLVSMPMDV